METKKVNLKDIKSNPKNPRTIRDEKFKKLVQSISEFPDMLSLRPIVVDENMMVLGGNMRLKACKEAGLKEVDVIMFKNLSEDKKKEFLIKDNTNFGEWDYLMLEEYETLNSWGMDLPEWATDLGDEYKGTEIDDDFFDSEFLDQYNAAKKKELDLNRDRSRQDWEGAYILFMLEVEDYDFIKKSESFILKKTGKNNLSDALMFMLKQ
jgi:hypothetical protein